MAAASQLCERARRLGVAARRRRALRARVGAARRAPRPLRRLPRLRRRAQRASAAAVARGRALERPAPLALVLPRRRPALRARSGPCDDARRRGRERSARCIGLGRPQAPVLRPSAWPSSPLPSHRCAARRSGGRSLAGAHARPVPRNRRSPPESVDQATGGSQTTCSVRHRRSERERSTSGLCDDPLLDQLVRLKPRSRRPCVGWSEAVASFVGRAGSTPQLR